MTSSTLRTYKNLRDLSIFLVMFISAMGLATQPKPQLAGRSFLLGRYLFSLPLPTTYQQVVITPDRVIFELVNVRYPNALELRLAPTTPKQGNWLHEQQFANGNIIHYTLKTFAGDVGSGGPEAQLVGVVHIGEVEVGVMCYVQAEQSPDARWCLEYVGRLELHE